MKRKELAKLLAQLREQANGADATSMMIALVRYASSAPMTADEVASACNISRRTVFRKETFSFTQCQIDTPTELNSARECQIDTPNSATQCQSDTLGSVTQCQIDTLDGDPNKERFSPHTPFSKERHTHFVRVCNNAPEHTHTHTHTQESLSDVLAKVRQEFVTSGSVCPTADNPQSPSDTVVNEHPSLKYEGDYEEFYRIYPKRAGLAGTGYLTLKAAWRRCEDEGWTGADILRALREAMHSQRWTEKEGVYKPNAHKFLNDEQFRDFLPIGKTPTASTPHQQTTTPQRAIEDDPFLKSLIYKP